MKTYAEVLLMSTHMFSGRTMQHQVLDQPAQPPSLILHCPLTESLDTAEFMNEEPKPGWDCVHAQDLTIFLYPTTQ